MERYLKSGKLLREKFDEIRFGKVKRQIDLEEVYKPLLKPLNEMVNNSSSTFVQPSIGPLAKHYLRCYSTKGMKTDTTFGLRSSSTDGKMYIGSKRVKIKGDDLFLPECDKEYKGTVGLWELLVKGEPDANLITAEDYDNFGDILETTHSYCVNNNPASRTVKSSAGYKYTKIIKPLLIKRKLIKVANTPQGSLTTPVKGSGLDKIVSKTPVEYVYWNTLDELLDRLYILWGERRAGNTNPTISNEIINILQEFKEL